LEDLEGAEGGALGLNHLDAGSTGANNGAAFALNVDTGVGPEGPVVDYAFEFVEWAEPFLWDVALRGASSADEEVFGLGDAAVFSLDVLAAFFGVELGVDDDAFGGAILFYLEDFVGVVKLFVQL